MEERSLPRDNRFNMVFISTNKSLRGCGLAGQGHLVVAQEDAGSNPVTPVRVCKSLRKATQTVNLVTLEVSCGFNSLHTHKKGG